MQANKHLLPAETTQADWNRLRNYAARNGITINEAILTLAELSAQMSEIGDALGIEDFERLPH